MYTIYAYETLNSDKVLYVLEEIGAKYEIKYIDLSRQENRTEEFLKINPFGKVPAMMHNGHPVFESAAMCRYIARNEKSPLYPQAIKLQSQVDQWLDFFNCHLGRWLMTLGFERIIKQKMGKKADENTCKEAIGFINIQMPPLEKWLGEHRWLAGHHLSIADFFAYAYFSHIEEAGLSLKGYPNIQRWLDHLAERPSIQKVTPDPATQVTARAAKN